MVNKKFMDALKKKEASQKTTGRTEVLAVKDDILEGLKAGYKKKLIYDVLCDEKKISITYQMFTRYVAEMIELEKQKATKKDRTDNNNPSSSENDFNPDSSKNIDRIK